MTPRSIAAGSLATVLLTAGGALVAAPALASHAAPHAARSAALTGSVAHRAGAVTVANFAFSPGQVGVALGDTVTWTFQDSTSHTSTSDQGFWDSGTKSGGATYALAFASAGTFPYHCSIHSSMHGVVKVGLKVTGSATTRWKVRWATSKGVGGRTFDVQVKRGHGHWKALFSGTSKAKTRFHPVKAGHYKIRARSVSGGATSGWSASAKVTVA